jgi:hypothetical protein
LSRWAMASNCLTAKIQVPNHRPHGLHRRGADCGVKAAEQRVSSETPNQTGPKAVPEEIEMNIRIRASTLAVLAVNDLGFGRMQFQVARCQAGAKLGLKGFPFLLASAVHQSIISISTPRKEV